MFAGWVVVSLVVFGEILEASAAYTVLTLRLDCLISQCLLLDLHYSTVIRTISMNVLEHP